MLLEPTQPSKRGLVRKFGVVSKSITGLAAGDPGPVRLNLTTGRAEKVAILTVGDYALGFVTNAGYLNLGGISQVTGVAGGVPLLGAYVSNQTVPGVASTPGWNVGTAFVLPTVPSDVRLDTIALVSQSALTCRVQIYDTVAGAAVSGSTLSVTGAGATVDTRAISGNLASNLIAGRIYQIRAECTGGNLTTDFSVVRYALVRGN